MNPPSQYNLRKGQQHTWKLSYICFSLLVMALIGRTLRSNKSNDIEKKGRDGSESNFQSGIATTIPQDLCVIYLPISKWLNLRLGKYPHLWPFISIYTYTLLSVVFSDTRSVYIYSRRTCECQACKYFTMHQLFMVRCVHIHHPPFYGTFSLRSPF